MASQSDKSPNAGHKVKKENAAGQKALGFWTSIEHQGSSRVVAHEIRSSTLTEAFKNDENLKQNTMDYIFGKTDENPLSEINEPFNAAIEKIENKMEMLTALARKK